MSGKLKVRDGIHSILNDLESKDYASVKAKLELLSKIKITTPNDRVLYQLCEYVRDDRDFCVICGCLLDEEDESISTCSPKCQTRLVEREEMTQLNQKQLTPDMNIGQWYYIDGSGYQQVNRKMVFWRDPHGHTGVTIFSLNQSSDNQEIERVPGRKIIVENDSLSKQRGLRQENIYQKSESAFGSLSLDQQKAILSKLRPMGSWNLSIRSKYKRGHRHIDQIRLYDTD